MFNSLARSQRGKGLLRTTRFVVLSNFLRTGIVEWLGSRPGRAASLDEIVEFYFASATPAPPEDVDLLQQYYRGAASPNKMEFVDYLLNHASWLKGRRQEVKFKPPEPSVHDWNPVVRALHVKHDPDFPGTDPARRRTARAHWNGFLTMADAFDIVGYDNERVQLSEGELAGLRRELELFGDGYYGVDDLLGVLLKVEALRGETSWIVRPPPFMLESCDAVARRIGIASYWRFSPRLRNGGCRVLDLGCGSGIYSNAFAERENKCVAVDLTPWVFFRAFLGARDGVQVECCDMNAMPERVTREPFTHAISNIAAHHIKQRPALFAKLRERLGNGGELCVLNFNYSLRDRPKFNPIAKLKRQFAAQIQYNWSVLEFDRGGVDFISPRDVARDMEQAGFAAEVHPCDPLKELWFVRGVKR
ncbi:MAG TPA: class I SAM-dependent methyltransferase [Verrucomicrobiae bacterium]|nr:class I SAM-dependent methyltransferase [Verrucomicrobiae bacterium]